MLPGGLWASEPLGTHHDLRREESLRSLGLLLGPLTRNSERSSFFSGGFSRCRGSSDSSKPILPSTAAIGQYVSKNSTGISLCQSQRVTVYLFLKLAQKALPSTPSCNRTHQMF